MTTIRQFDLVAMRRVVRETRDSEDSARNIKKVFQDRNRDPAWHHSFRAKVISPWGIASGGTGTVQRINQATGEVIPGVTDTLTNRYLIELEVDKEVAVFLVNGELVAIGISAEAQWIVATFDSAFDTSDATIAGTMTESYLGTAPTNPVTLHNPPVFASGTYMFSGTVNHSGLALSRGTAGVYGLIQVECDNTVDFEEAIRQAQAFAMTAGDS